MNKPNNPQDELRPEHRKSELVELLKNEARGKYMERYREGTNLVILAPDLDATYQQMAQEEQREAEALEWAEATIRDVAEESIKLYRLCGNLPLP